MLVLTVVVLTTTNAATAAALWWHRRRPATAHPDDHDVHTAVAAHRPVGVTGRTRRVISVEILNPIELAGTRGRVAGIAGSLAPGLTRRIVYDRTLKTLRRQLVEQQVVADVRLHTLREARPAKAPIEVEPPAEEGYLDEVEIVEFVEQADDQPV